ncbi:MAG: DUF2490 domain-containing protein [Tannerella sp.]|jgi:hypothetical protein|nr:DUF2490 domain-containing protein [Tannerella sp.]
MTKKRISVYCTVCTVSFFLCAAGVSPAIAEDAKKQDAGIWAAVTVAPRPFGGKWHTACTLEYRNNGNFREISQWRISANANYCFNPYLRAGMGYELYLNRQADGCYLPEYRCFPEATLSYNPGAFSISLRSRLAYIFSRPVKPQWEERNRLRAICAVGSTPLKLFVSAEPYLSLYPAPILFRKIRYTAGCSFRLNSRQRIDAYYLHEDFLHIPCVRQVVGIEYGYAF